MDSGAAVVIGGRLPADVDGHRVGWPDLLVRGADTVDGRPGYHPVEVKWHKIIERCRPRAGATEPSVLRYTSLERPDPQHSIELPGHGLRLGSRAADFVQLAHYRRMLEAAGYASADPLAAVIGTDEVPEGPVLAWLDLTAPVLRTFSRSHPEGWRLRSTLDRYDHEHRFRVAVADAARRQTGGALPDRRPAGPPDRQPRVHALRVVGTLPPPTAPRRRQPADRQGRPRPAGDRGAAEGWDHHHHRPGRG